MSFIKKLTAAAAAAAMLLSLTACGSNTRIAANAGSLEIPAGVFIYYEGMSVSAASSKLPADADPKTALIEDKTSDQWILDETDRILKRFAAVENIFAEKGYELTDEENTSIDSQTDYLWNASEDAYVKQGIAKSSLRMIVANSIKEDKVFSGIYGKGGEKEYPESDMKKWFDDNYAYVEFIAIQLKTSDGTLYKDDQKKNAKELADSYITRAATEDFSVLMEEYDTEYKSAYKEANGTDSTETVTTLGLGTGSGEYANTSLYEKNGTYPSETFVNAVKNAQTGKAFFIDDSNADVYYVAKCLKASGNSEFVEKNADSIRYEACSEDFEKDLIAYTDSNGFTKNQAAYSRYKMGLEDLTAE